MSDTLQFVDVVGYRDGGNERRPVRFAVYRAARLPTIDRLKCVGHWFDSLRVISWIELFLRRYVALKLITPQFMRNEEFVARFKREARAAGRLRHPNVVDVTDFGFAHAGGEAVAYLVMEYLDGCTLWLWRLCVLAVNRHLID
jgi:serine/threonine protein kinase